MDGADLWLDFGIAVGTVSGSLYVIGNMIMWAWWLRTSDALLRWFFWAVIFVMVGIAQWSGTNAYLIWNGLNDPPRGTLFSRIVLLIGIGIMSLLTIGVFRQRKYNHGRFAGPERRCPFPPPPS